MYARKSAPWVLAYLCLALGVGAVGCAADNANVDNSLDGGSACTGCAGTFGNATIDNSITAQAGTSAAGGGSAGTSGAPDGVIVGGAGTTAGPDATTGDAGPGAWDSVDAGPQMPGLGMEPCPAGFSCVTDPLIGKLSVCLKDGGPLPLPVSCTTDAECVAGGLPKATCVSEEETGLNGCMQLCTPPAAAPGTDAGM